MSPNPLVKLTWYVLMDGGHDDRGQTWITDAEIIERTGMSITQWETCVEVMRLDGKVEIKGWGEHPVDRSPARCYLLAERA